MRWEPFRLEMHLKPNSNSGRSFSANAVRTDLQPQKIFCAFLHYLTHESTMGEEVHARVRRVAALRSLSSPGNTHGNDLGYPDGGSSA